MASSSASSVAAALQKFVAESEEPAVKKAHTASSALEEKMGQMGDQNKALFEALTLVFDSKLESRMKTMDAALGAVAAATDKGFQELKKELQDEKEARKSSAADLGRKLEEVRAQNAVPVASTEASAPRARPRSVGARSLFTPKKVFVQGFFDFESGMGSLKPQERDELCRKLVEDIPQALRDRFQLEKRYAMTRRLVFSTKGGGE